MICNGTLDKKNATFTSVRKMIEKVSEGQRKEIKIHRWRQSVKKIEKHREDASKKHWFK